MRSHPERARQRKIDAENRRLLLSASSVESILNQLKGEATMKGKEAVIVHPVLPLALPKVMLELWEAILKVSKDLGADPADGIKMIEEFTSITIDMSDEVSLKYGAMTLSYENGKLCRVSDSVTQRNHYIHPGATNVGESILTFLRYLIPLPNGAMYEVVVHRGHVASFKELDIATIKAVSEHECFRSILSGNGHGRYHSNHAVVISNYGELESLIEMRDERIGESRVGGFFKGVEE